MVLSSFESNLYFLLPGDLDTWPMTLTFTQDLGVIDLHQHTSCRSNGTSAAELTFCMVLNNVFDLVTSYFDLWPWPSHLTYIPSIFIIAPYFMAVSPIVQVWGHRKCKVLVYWKCTCKFVTWAKLMGQFSHGCDVVQRGYSIIRLNQLRDPSIILDSNSWPRF